MEPIRILHMIGSLNIGGSQTMILNLYRAIDRKKIQFDFVIDHSDELALAEQVEALGAKIYTVPTFNGRNFAQVRQAWDQFFREHPEYKILHSHVRSYASLYLPIAKKYGLTTIIHSHSTSNGKGLKAFVKAAMQYPLRYQADYLFGCSQEASQWLFGKKAVQQPNYRMIPNGIDCKRYYFSEEDRLQVRRELGIPEDSKVVGHIGRFHEAKNHGFLINVFAEALKRDASLRLLLVGDGDLRSEVERQCDQLGICESVIFTGAQSDIPRYYSAIDLFLFPSKWEGLPVSVVEAQASGLPCILSDTVTKNVWLTDLVEYLPLTAGVEVWAQRILERLSMERKVLSEGGQRQLESFDVRDVAQNLQVFYLSV